MKTIKSAALALFGTLIEYYDYALYGFAAPILANHFFPKNDPTVMLLQAYGIFFAGSCSKPLGSLLFGFIGDRFGRAFALKLSIFGIAIPTMVIGCLPDYQTLGWLAACLLFLCRILQGIFVSGESDSARVFLYESLPNQYRCFASGFAYCLCMLGIYWASFSLTTIFSETSPYSKSTSAFLNTLFGIQVAYWRLPFLMAGLFGVLLFVLRQCLTETQLFLEVQQERLNQKTTLKFFSIRKINKKSILMTLLMTGAAGGQYHFYFVFLQNYLSQILNTHGIVIPTVSPAEYSELLLVFALCLPLAGLLADRLNTRLNLLTLLKSSSLVIISLAVLNLLFMLQGYLPYSLMFITVVGLSFAQANTFVAILQQFTVQERCRGASLGHALGSTLLSGSTPFMCLTFWNITRIPVAPFWYFLLLCLMSFVALLFLEHRENTSKFLFAETVL